MATPGSPVAIGPEKNYLDYPVGSPERAQLQAKERSANLAAAQVQMAVARSGRENLASLASAEVRAREEEQRKRDQYNRDHSGWSGFGWRVSDFFTHGVLKQAQVPFGMTYDIARAAVRDDTQVMPTIAKTLTQRIGGQSLNAWTGPQGMVGSLVGMIPPSARDVARSGLQPVGEALGNTRREMIIEPLLNLGQGRSPLAGISDTGAQDPTLPRTLGRALVEGWNGNPDDGWGQVISGGVDVASAVFLDPAQGGAKLAHGARTKVLEEAGYGVVKSAGALEHVVGSGAFTDFTERAVAGKPAARIYNELLPNHPNGLAIATVLEESHKALGVEGVKLATRSMLGDADAAAQLASKAEDAAVILDNAALALDQTQESLRAYRAGRASPPMRLPEAAHLGQTVEPTQAVAKAEATRELAMARRAAAMHGELDRLPRQTTAGGIRTGANAIGERIGSRSDWYQNSPWARPVHAIYDRLPKGRVNLNNPASSADLNRMLGMARLPPDEADGWMGRYGQAVNTSERRAVMEQAETAAIKNLADRAGLGVDDVDALLSVRGQGKSKLAETLTNRIYEGNGRDLLVEDMADRPLHQIHIETGAFGPDEYALTDFHQVRRVVTKWGQFKARHPAASIPISMLHEANDLWRITTVGKIATSATIQLDQQFRIYVKLGALTQLGSLASRGKDYIVDLARGVEPELRGIREFEYRGVTGPSPWGTTPAEIEATKALNSSRGVNKLMSSAELGLRKLFGTPGGRTIYPTEAGHATELAKVLNNQIGDDPLNRMLLEGATTDEAVAWLKGPEGRAYTAKVPLKRRDPQGWVEARAQHIEDMTGGSAELKALALDRNVKGLDIEGAMPDPSTRPFVNRLLSDNMTAHSSTIQTVQKAIDGFFRVVQSWPDDVLSRNTLYSELYNGEMERLIDVYAGGRVARIGRKGAATVPDDVVAQFSKVARTKALVTTKNLLYDLADQSRAAEILRFAVPFFEPVREQATVFAQLANEAPTRYLRAMALLRAPLRAGLIYDDRGLKVGEDGKHRDPLTDEVLPESMWGSREMLHFTLPSWTRGVPWFGEALGGKQVSLDMGSIRVGMPQSVGFGPMVQIPVNQVARQRPDLVESLDFVLPFGTTNDSLLRQMSPAFIKKFADASNRDDDNRTMRGLEASSLLAKITSFHQTTGRVPNAAEKRQLEQEAIDEARAVMHLRAVVGYTSPFQIGFDSPYKAHADVYRMAQSVYFDAEKTKGPEGNLSLADPGGLPRDPDQWFVDTFGDEYFALTQSVTRSKAGIPATIGGVAAEKKYRDLIDAHPDVGGLIIGDEGAGEYNRTIAQQQFATETRPGSGEKQREFLPLSGAPGKPGISTSPEIAEGWMQYMAGMDIIDGKRKALGLPNLQVKAAVELSEMKRTFVEDLKAEYPAWRDEFEDVDQGKWRRRITDLEAVAADKRLQNRPEIRLLGEYLDGRKWIQGELAQRKSKTLDAKANMDLVLKWEEFTTDLTSQSLAFADTYNRYLSNDPVT